MNSLYYAKKVSNDINFPLNGAIFQTDSITEVARFLAPTYCYRIYFIFRVIQVKSMKLKYVA